MTPKTLRADLHLHSDHSGLKHLKFLKMRDCYSPPVEVYRRAKVRGMDLVTLTDHDTIDGCLEIRDRLNDPDDFFMSEEVETFLPGRRSMHIGVFGITEAQHREIQKIRLEFEDLVSYLEEQNIPCALNHLFRGYRPNMDVEEYLIPLVRRFHLYETRNGTQSARYRRLTAESIARLRGAVLARPGETGGSDAHTLLRVGRTWTECEATDRDSFLAALGEGRSTAGGEDGELMLLTRDVYAIVFSYYGQLLGRTRVRFDTLAERLPGALFCAATLPSHLIGFPFLCTTYNQLAKQVGLARIRQGLGRVVEPPEIDPSTEVEAEI